jgi:predicted transcriptional regulator
MDRKSRLARNEAFVAKAKAGMSLEEIAGEAKVSHATVRNVLQSAGVRPKRNDNRAMPSAGFRILAKLLKGEGDSDIARELGITRQRVHEVKMKARRFGIEV